VKLAANLQQVKEANRSLIYSLIHLNGPLGRSDLTSLTRLSPTTVSALVGELIIKGLVKESGPALERSMGRKPTLLSIEPLGGFVLSSELTQDGFELAVFDLRCALVDKVKEVVKDYSTIGQRLIAASEALIKNLGLPEHRLGGFCIGAPALIDPSTQRVMGSTVLPKGALVDFVALLRRRFPGVTVRLENESGLCAYAEKEYGAASGLKDILYVDINIGIGAGILLGGHLFRGNSGMAGELGHVSIDIDGTPCPCGNRGCVELMANIPALVERVRQGLETGKASIIGALCEKDYRQMDFTMILEAARKKDPLVLEAIDEIARYLACGINSALNILNPQAIVIGGMMADLGEALISRIEGHLTRIALQAPINGAQRIRRTSVRGNAATLGGARMMLDEILKLPTLGQNGEI